MLSFFLMTALTPKQVARIDDVLAVTASLVSESVDLNERSGGLCEGLSKVFAEVFTHVFVKVLFRMSSQRSCQCKNAINKYIKHL